MAIYMREMDHRGIPEQDAFGGLASLFATTKGEITAEDAVVTTVNAGDLLCLPGSSCITKAGEVLFLDDAGIWAEV